MNEQERTVWLEKNNVSVTTASQNPREIEYLAAVQRFNEDRDNYFSLTPLETTRENIVRAALQDQQPTALGGVLRGTATGVASGVQTLQRLGEGAIIDVANRFRHAREKNALTDRITWINANIKRENYATDEEYQTARNAELEKYRTELAEVETRYKNVAEFGRREMEKLKKRQENFLKLSGLSKQEGDGIFYDAGQGIGSLFAALGITAVTKSPTAAAALFGGIAGRQGYEEALENGASPEKALWVGAAAGAAEGVLEKVGLDIFLRGLSARGWTKRVIKNALTEAVQEGSQGGAEEFIMQHFGGREKEFYDTAVDIAYQSLLGGLVGGGVAGIPYIGKAFAEYSEADRESIRQEQIEQIKAATPQEAPARITPPTPEQAEELARANGTAQDAVMAHYNTVVQNGVQKLMDLGADEKTAQQVVAGLIAQAGSQESLREISQMIEDENNPATYSKQDILASAAEFAEAVRATAQDLTPELKKQLWDIRDRVKQDALRAGLAEDEAELSSKMEQALATVAYQVSGAAPADWYKGREIRFVNKRAAETSFDFGANAPEQNAAAANGQTAMADSQSLQGGRPLGGTQEGQTQEPPAEYDVERYGLPDAVLFQGTDAYDKSGKARTDTPEFKEWSGNNPLVKAADAGNYRFETGKGVTVEAFHGSPNSGIEFFDNARQGTHTHSLDTKGAFFFVNNPSSAHTYTQGQSDALQELSQQIEKANNKTQDVRAAIKQEFGSVNTLQDHQRLEERIRQDPRYMEANEAENKLRETYIWQRMKQTGEVLNVYLSIKNPLALNLNGQHYNTQLWQALINKAKKDGRDGIIIQDTTDIISDVYMHAGDTEYIVFEPTQIKSVYNRGTWDAKNPNIFHQTAYQEQEGNVASQNTLLELNTQAELNGRSEETFKKDMLKKLYSMRGEKIFNTSLQKDIDIRISSINKYIHFFADPKKRFLVPYLKGILQQAQFHKEASYSPKKERNIRAYYKANVGIAIDGNPYSVYLTVKEDDKGHYFWDAQVKEQEIKNEEQATVPVTSPGVANSSIDSIEVKERTVKPRRLSQSEEAEMNADIEYLFSKFEGKIHRDDIRRILVSRQTADANKIGGGLEHVMRAFKARSTDITQAQIRSIWNYQPVRLGSVEFTNRGPVITLLEGANKSTVAHEMTHVFLRELELMSQKYDTALMRRHMAKLEAFLGPKQANGYYSQQQHEKLAKGYLDYIRTQEAPNVEMKNIFDRFKDFLEELYEDLRGTKLFEKITPAAKEFFDDFLTPLDIATPDAKKFRGKIKEVREAVEDIRKRRLPRAELGITLKDVKDLYSQIKKRMPKTDGAERKNWKEELDIVRQTSESLESARDVLEKINDMERKGYRVIDRADVKFLEEKLKKTERLAHTELDKLEAVKNEIVAEFKKRVDADGVSAELDRLQSAKNKTALELAARDMMLQVENAYVQRTLKQVGLLNNPHPRGASARYAQDVFDKELAESGLPEVKAGGWKRFSEEVKDVFASVSDRVARIDKELARQLEEIPRRRVMRNSKYRKYFADYIDYVYKYVKPNERDFMLLSWYQMNGFYQAEMDVAKKYANVELNGKNLEQLIAEKDAGLKQIWEDAVQAGLKVGWLEYYNPRRFKDADGFITAVQGTPEWSKIERMLKGLDPDNHFTQEQKAIAINKWLRGYEARDLAIASPKNIKRRDLIYVSAPLSKFYKNSYEALIDYADDMAKAVSVKEVFGVNAENLEQSVGHILLKVKEKHHLTHWEEEAVRKALVAFLQPKNPSEAVRQVKTWTYLLTITNPFSTLSQLEDLGLAAIKWGHANFMRALKTRGTDKWLTLEYVGAETLNVDLNKEFENRTEKALRWILGKTAFTWMDRLGKESYINADFQARQEAARKNPKKLMTELREMFSEEEAQSVFEALKTGDINNEFLKSLLYYDISRVQPLSMMDMPYAYGRGGNLRYLYTLKSFALRRANFIFSEVQNKLHNAQTPEEYAQAVKELLGLLVGLVGYGALTNILKNLLLGRSVDLPEEAADALLQNMMITRYVIKRAADDPMDAFVNAVMPPGLGIINDVWKDTGRIMKGNQNLQDARVWTNVPLIGKEYYWWFGGGALKTKKDNKKKELFKIQGWAGNIR